MPKITIHETGQIIDAQEGRRLVLVLEDAGVGILHRCGGLARCTTCRVEVLQGDAGPMNEAERAKIEAAGLVGKYRLSCQILVKNDLTVHPAMTTRNTGLDPGRQPSEELPYSDNV